MKKFIIPITIILISGLLILNYFAYKSPKVKKMLAQKTIYQTKETQLTIPLYANYKGAYQDVEAISSVFLIDGSKRLEIIPLSISPSTKYTYLKETFTKYNYVFMLPALENHYYMDEAQLEILLKNGDKATFSIGSFDYYYQEHATLELIELYANKYEDAYQVKDITIKFQLDTPIVIEKIKLSNTLTIYVDKTIQHDQFSITIPKQYKIIDQVALVIYYEKNNQTYIEVLPDYLFFDSHENKLDYGYLNDVKRMD